MQGLWTNHRRGKINLNASPGVSAPSTPQPLDENEDRVNTVDDALAPNLDAASPAAKRKARPARTEDAKRLKSSVASAITKDHTPPTTRLSDLGGVDTCIEKMLELVAMPLCHPEIYLHTGVQPPRGVLLHGPPGCGKTLLANAIAGVRFLNHLLRKLAYAPPVGTGSVLPEYFCAFHRLRHVG